MLDLIPDQRAHWTTMGTRANTQEPDEITLYRKACWEVMERAAASIHLSRAARLREFLFYVGAKCLKDGSTEVHEQEIGAGVFGRQEHYDTSQDLSLIHISEPT